MSVNVTLPFFNARQALLDRIAHAISFLSCGCILIAVTITGTLHADEPDAPTSLMGGRYYTFISFIRVNQDEVTRDRNLGRDEVDKNTVADVQNVRDNFGKAFPDGRMTWAFSWRALNDPGQQYRDVRAQVVEYHKRFGDEITFIPGGYFAPMYNSREQVNRDLHDGLKLVSDMVGGGYRPKCVIAGYLAADNMRYLAEQEGIHVAQGIIWSQYAIDNGDGDGSISYPYYPSREHFCKPAQGAADFIDCVCLDGWTCDFLAARRVGFQDGFNSRMGLGPIETVARDLGPTAGLEEMLYLTGVHFDDGFRRNGFGWVTAIWEVSLGKDFANPFQYLPDYGREVRQRWPDVQAITEGEFGELFRSQFHDNSNLDYRFVERGSGFGGSDKNLEIRWFMNKDFRLALIHDWTKPTSGPPKCTNPKLILDDEPDTNPELVLDFTRYDLKAQEPPDGGGRNWSLMNVINQKGTRPQDKPVPLSQLPADDQAIINKRLPELFSPDAAPE